MKYPLRSDWDSVYDGFELEIHIVDHCNLNCAGCNHFTSLAEEYFIEKDLLIDQLKIVKERLPSLKRLMLIGGEPCLHPQLLDLCIAVRELLPEVTIDVLSNGSLLKVIDKNKEQYKALDIGFLTPLYGEPIKYDEQLAQSLLDYGVLRQSFSRMAFMQPAVDIYGTQDAEYQFYNECHVKKPCLTLKNYKIYECPWSAHLNNFCNFVNIEIPEIKDDDYLDLHTVTLEQLEEWCYKPKNRCKYCKLGSPWMWHPSSRSIEEWTWDLYDYYVSRYDEYLYKINYNKSFLNKFLRDRDDPVYLPPVTKLLYARYFGKIDIIIPYYKIKLPLVDRLIDSLKQQTIIDDCVIYIVSDNSPVDRFVIEKFKQSGLNFIYLKNQVNSGPGVARNHAIDNSYNNYLYFFDIDDYFIESTALEDAYKTISENNLDGVFVLKQSQFNPEGVHVHDTCISRTFLEKMNLKYRNVYCHEDDIVSGTLQLFGNYTRLNKPYSVYSRDNDYTANKTYSDIELLISSILSYYYTLKQAKVLIQQHQVDESCLKMLIYDLFDWDKIFNNYDIKQVEFLKKIIVFYYAVLIKVSELFPTFIPTDSYWAKQIQENSYFFKINDKTVFFSKEDILNYFSNFLNDFSEKKKVFYAIQQELKEVEYEL